MDRIKVAFTIDVDDSTESWTEGDTEVLHECVRQSLDVWGDIRGFSVEVQQ
jgi:hypothetical protein